MDSTKADLEIPQCLSLEQIIHQKTTGLRETIHQDNTCRHIQKQKILQCVINQTTCFITLLYPGYTSDPNAP